MPPATGAPGACPMFKPMADPNHPNYVIAKIFCDCDGNYAFAVVTDPEKQSLYILSRYKRPSKESYGFVMDYITKHFDRDRLVQVPHYD